MRLLSIIIVFVSLASSCKKEDVPEKNQFMDERDGRTYKTVKIGDQVWMAQNLAYLPDLSSRVYYSGSDPMYYIYGNSSSDPSEGKSHENFIAYGVLYNWPAAHIACPPGWHLPTEQEWQDLEEYLGMNQGDLDVEGLRESGRVGEQMKSITMWKDGGNGTNTSQLNILPGGYLRMQTFESYFTGKGEFVSYWANSEYGSGSAYRRSLSSKTQGIYRGTSLKYCGHYTRCIKD